MFDSAELKALRQEIDGLTEQLRILVENQEMQHQDVMAKLDMLEEAVGKEVSQDDVEDIKTLVEATSVEVSDLAETVQSIDDHLGEEKTQ